MNAVELLLDGAHALPVGSSLQRPAGVGGNVVAYRRVKYDVDIIAVVVLQDLIGDISCLRQIHAAPLAQSAALSAHAVTERGEQRFHAALPHDIVVEDVVHDAADVFKYIAAADIGLIPRGGVGDVEIIPAAAVVFRIDPIQGKGDLGHNVGPQRCLRPCGI